jgi:hypothetical protein
LDTSGTIVVGIGTGNIGTVISDKIPEPKTLFDTSGLGFVQGCGTDQYIHSKVLSYLHKLVTIGETLSLYLPIPFVL